MEGGPWPWSSTPGSWGGLSGEAGQAESCARVGLGGDATGLPSGVNHTGTGVFYALGFWVSMGRRFRWAVLRVCGTRTPHTHLVASTSCCLWPPTIGFGPQRGVDSTHPDSSSGTAFVSKPRYNWGPPAPASIGVDLVPIPDTNVQLHMSCWPKTFHLERRGGPSRLKRYRRRYSSGGAESSGKVGCLDVFFFILQVLAALPTLNR